MIPLIIFFFISLTTIITIWNLIYTRIINNVKRSSSTLAPLVSILIPARNESDNIEECIKSIEKQCYKNIEIIVYNDESTDDTLTKLQNINNIKILNGEPVPSGWLGKNYACYNLANAAAGDYLLFIDADVRIAEDIIFRSLDMFNKFNISIYSVFPKQVLNKFEEYFITPNMNWFLLTFLPLQLVYLSRFKSFSAANGQYLMFKKNSYFKLGGHSALRNNPVEDVGFIKLAKKKRLKSITTAINNSLVQCKMYNNNNEAINGFTKNFYNGAALNPVAYTIVLLIILTLFLSPFTLWYYQIFLLCILLIIVQRVVISIISGQKIFNNIILHPIQMIIFTYIGFRSMYYSLKGKIEWKSRIINS